MIGWLATVLLAGLAPALDAQEEQEAPESPGYRVEADRVEVSRPEEWQVWQAPPGVRVIGPDGTVEPFFARRIVDATRNAADFTYVSEGDTLTGGIKEAGSAPELAPFIIDGDPQTFWEPDANAPVGNWFVEIDLGRAVVVTRIVVRFVDEALGDPFLKFRLLISDGRTTFTQTRRRQLFRVGLVNEPNKDQRQFVFPVEPQERSPEGLEGEVAQFVRLEVLESAGARGREVSRQVYESLPPQDQGAIDYFRRTVADRQINVEQRIYDLLPPENQGTIRYYRRERPRLAEVEVHTLGDNVVRLTRAPLEISSSLDDRRRRRYTDGLFSTFQGLFEYDELRNENQLQIDLGARYWLDRIRLLSPAEPPPAYQLRVSDGTLNPDGQRVWRLFDERLNRDAFLQLEERFAPRQVRFIELRRLAVPGARGLDGNISEVQAYGEGFVSTLIMQSPLLRLERPRLFGRLSWEGEAPPGTAIEVRTRSGSTLERIPHYYNSSGREVSPRTWNNLPEDRQGPVEIEELPDASWSRWSSLYRTSGEAFKSPSPRRYVLAEVRLVSQEPLRAPRIRRLTLDFAPPLVDGAVAEIWPNKNVAPGVPQRFTLYLRPSPTTDNPGFDRLILGTSAAAPIELETVRAGGRLLWPGPLEVVPGEEGDVELRFAEPVVDEQLLALRFRTQLFLSNTQFSLRLTHSQRPGLVQEATPGDATPLVTSQALAVIADVGAASLLDSLRVDPPLFTPNGDGINDRVTIEAAVFVVQGAKELEVEIRDLAGRLVRDLSQSRSRPSGTQRFIWDGRDQQGRLVPPGMYLVRLGFATDVDAAQTRALRLVHVVY